MPELINTFIKGKMNKDLDERLVPNGEYRDALNLEVATSDGSDVGTLQTLLGNEKRINRLYDPLTQLHQTWSSYTPDGSKYIPSSAVAIGSVKDPAKERIYWFITDYAVDAIVQYDQTTDTVYPILVDIKSGGKGVLNFKANKLVTGSNIIGSEPDSDGFLFWTDNNSEPKKIEISKFREGTIDFSTHTQVFNRNFELQDVTVIKKSPLLAPTIYKKRTVRDGEIRTTTSAEFATLDTTDPEVDPTEIIVQDFGTIATYSWANAVNYFAGDFLLLTIQDPDDNYDREFQVRLKVLNPINEYSASCELQTAGSDIPTGIQGWDVELELDDPLFEFKFPRFAFRYKYDDNQFSTFSPFTDITFIPGYDFEYTGADGYNLAMTNNIRVLEIRDFVPSNIPDDVVAVDILYKDTASTNIYKVDTIERDSEQWNDNSYQPVGNICQFSISVDTDEPSPVTFSYTDQFGQPGSITVQDGGNAQGIIAVCGSLVTSSTPSDPSNISIDSLPRPDIAPTNNSGRIKIETELISSLLPSNQILRPYDNVPKKALAQEITANRLIYGNYTQNFDMVDYAGDEVIPKFDFSIVHDPTKIQEATGDVESTDPIAGVPVQSLKTMRTYQMGVVYLDEFGRQTPVFTNDSGGRSLAKEFGDLYNTINVRLTNNPPNWAKHYKYYIKETANEYYNIALDRFYLPDDGSCWLSFPSADRNKVDEETFLELKKQHDNDNFIPDPARYKVLAISNEAPDSIKQTNTLKGSGTSEFTQEGFPLQDRGFVELTEESFENLFGEGGSSVIGLGDLVMSISGGSNISDKFPVASVQKQGSMYRVQLEQPMNVSVAFTSSDGSYENRLSDTFTITIYQSEFKRKVEFDGRFFVRVYKDAVLEQNILKDTIEGELFVEYVKPVAFINRSGRSNWWKDGDPRKIKGWFWDAVSPNSTRRTGGSLKYQSGNPSNFPRTGVGIGVGQRKLNISWHGFGNPWKEKKSLYRREHAWWGWPSNDPDRIGNLGFSKQLDTSGSLFRFTDDPNKEDSANTYTIKKTYRAAYTVDNRKTGRHGSGKYGSQRVVRWCIIVNKPIQWIPYSGATGSDNPPQFGVEFLKLYETDGDTYSSENPAIFETYPKEAIDMDLYYAASDIYDIENPGTQTAAHASDIKKLSWFNCYSFGQGVESNRIRDDFNQPIIDKNPIVSTVLDEAYGEESKATGLIFSGIFNSRSGINRLNQFIQAEAITKDLNPAFTSIQKLFARDTNLITLCEDKCLQILANKDALFNADGNTNITSNKAVLGQAMPYAGEYGISQNPESFAAYGNRAYFTDKNRGVVLRLAGGLGGGQGLTEISAANMRDFFNDNLHSATKLIGTYDDDKDVYYLTLDKLTNEWQTKLKLNDPVIYPNGLEEGTTVAFKEDVKGWTSRKDFIVETGLSLNNKYYSLKSGEIWEHGSENVDRNNFYGVQYDSAMRFIFNQEPAVVKNFKTLNYSGSESRKYLYTAEGQSALKQFNIAEIKANNYTPTNEITTRGWYNNFMFTNLQDGSIKEFLDKEGKYFNYIKGIGTQFITNTDNNLDSHEFSMQGIGRAEVTGDVRSAYNLSWFVDSTCYDPFQAPIASNTTMIMAEDCGLDNSCTIIDLNNFVTDNNSPAETLTFTLVNDSTSNGVLTVNATTGIVTFVPNADFNGSAGAFTYTVSNSQLTSNVATVDITVTSVNDGPFWTTDPATVPSVNPGDPWTFTMNASVPDHAGNELTISVANLPSWATFTDNGDGSCTVAGNILQGQYTFTVTVTDPGGLSADLEVSTQSLAAILEQLRFVGRYVASSVSGPQTLVDPDGTSVQVCGSTVNGGHTCNRGSFKVLANGVAIGTINISNTGGGGYYAGSLANTAANPDYPHTVMTDLGVPSGNEEYYYDNSAGNNQPMNNDRYDQFRMDVNTAQAIADASGNGDISFTLECNTFTGASTQTQNCHSNALWFSIFRPGYGQYLCTSFSTSSLITINAFTGNEVNPIP